MTYFFPKSLVLSLTLLIVLAGCTDTLVLRDSTPESKKTLSSCFSGDELSQYLLSSQTDSIQTTLLHNLLNDRESISIWKVKDTLEPSAASHTLSVDHSCTHVAMVLTDTTDAVLGVLFNDELEPGMYRWTLESGIRAYLKQPLQRFNIVTIAGNEVSRLGPAIYLK